MNRLFFNSILTMAMFFGMCTTALSATKGYSYHNLSFDLAITGNAAITIAVHDQRPIVVNGTRQPDFGGYLRNGWGMAYPTGTFTKQPLTDDMALSLTNAFAGKGFKAQGVITTPDQSPDDVLAKIKSTNCAYSLVITLVEWHGDGYTEAEINYNLTAKLYDSNNQLLAEKTIGPGHEILPKPAKKNVGENNKRECPVFSKNHRGYPKFRGLCPTN